MSLIKTIGIKLTLHHASEVLHVPEVLALQTQHLAPPSAHTTFMLSQVAPASGTYTCRFFLELLSPWICGLNCHSHLGRNIPPGSGLLDHQTLHSTQHILPTPHPPGFLSPFT